MTLTDLRLLEREPALDMLDGCVARLKSGMGGVVAVSGEAGLGKTSVLRALGSRAGDGVEILRGGCEDLSMPRLLGPFFDMVDHLDDEIAEALSDEQRHGQLFSLFPAMLRNRKIPVIMVIEDIHWADDATLDLIKFLGRRAADLPLLLILSYRDDEPDSAFSTGRVLGTINPGEITRIALLPLSSDAIARLASGTAHDARDILAVTGGNPFFVTEILAEGGRAADGLPLSVRDAVWSRIERCSALERSILEAISIIPRGASRDLLRHLCPDAQADELDRLVATGMLMEDGDALRFRHELARQASLQLLPEGKRRSLHLNAGDWLAKSRRSDDLTILVQRIHHARAAADTAAIVGLAPIAARRAAAAGAHKQAAQLFALALPYADGLPADDAALLYEGWSHEAGLAEQIDDAAIAARRKAVELWQSLGRTDKVGFNLLWLSRFLWYRGEGDEAQAIAQQALVALESCEPGEALAWSHCFRSQSAMLNDRFAESIEWGDKAIALARQLGEHEALMHALNSVGSSLMLVGEIERGKALLIESLTLALEHGAHVQAARAYTNLAENGLAVGDLETAHRFLEEGIAFDMEYDLDSWLHYLRGCKARFLMMAGKLGEAATLARDVLNVPNQTLVMRLPAQTVLSHIALRTGDAAGVEDLATLLEQALGTKEPQRIAPVRIALAEAMWLAEENLAARAQVDTALENGQAFQGWHVGDLCCWAYRVGQPVSPLPEGLPEPMELECTGRVEEAAKLYARLGMPFEEAMALCGISGEGRGRAVGRAIELLTSMGAVRAAERVTAIAVAERLIIPKPPRRRGSYSVARSHPAGLTAKEQRILRLLNEGASNAMIATKLNRSIRTVEHHVAAVLAKLDVANRSEVISKVNSNPHLLGD